MKEDVSGRVVEMALLRRHKLMERNHHIQCFYGATVSHRQAAGTVGTLHIAMLACRAPDLTLSEISPRLRP